MTASGRALNVVSWVTGIVAVAAVGGVLVAILGLGLVRGLVHRVEQATEFEAARPSCFLASDTEAWLTVDIAPANPGRVMAVQVEEADIVGGMLTGVAMLPGDATLSSLSDAELVGLQADFNDADSGIDVTEGSGQVVLRLQRRAGDVLEMRSLRLWFAYGEPAATQALPLTVLWDAGCEATI